MSTIMDLVRSDLLDFSPYVSVVSSINCESIRLSANELPWGESVSGDLASLNRYPEQQPFRLVEGLAEYYNVGLSQILLTRGSTEGIDLLLRLFCEAGKDAILICPPTFGMYETLARIQGANVYKVPLNEKDFSLQTEQILNTITPDVKMVFLCSPNNPTGNLMSYQSVVRLCEALKGRAIVVLDEAYIEFAKTASLSWLITQYDNLVILRTMSKAFGFAGGRIGAVLGSSEVILLLRQILAPYPLCTASIETALTVLTPNRLKKMNDYILKVMENREWLREKLMTLSIVSRVWTSCANFILAEFTEPVVKFCQQEKIIVRSIEHVPNTSNAARITIGTQIENERLIACLEKL